MLTYQEIKADVGIRSELDNIGFPAVLKYLRDRGIEGRLIDDLGLSIQPASSLIARARGGSSADDRLAVVFPHFNVAGDFIDWWSCRLVDCGLRQAVVSFANLVPHKRGKMFCPPNEPPHAYLPPILDWTKLQRGDKVYIHESCIKAIAGARLDTWSVGLNGVWGFGSKKHQIGLVQELRDLPWKALDLQPVIVFDSNAEDNWDIQAAIGRLAAKLFEVTGQRATHLLLPRDPDGQHWGFDDYVASHGDEAGAEFLRGEGQPIEISGVELLKLQLNEEVCVVRSLGRIADQATGDLMSRATFTDVNYAHYMAEIEDKWVGVPKLWLQDPRRVEVNRLTYAPGQPKLYEGDLNVWLGMGLEAAKGAGVAPWLALLANNVSEGNLRTWMVQWMAYPLQHLGAKLTTYLHLFGPPGTGKQAILAPLLKIYGDANAVVIGKDQVASSFNSVYANKQFINLDELHGGGEMSAIAIANRIKMLITGEKLVVNMKGVPEYSVPNCAQVVSTSNYSDAIKLDDDDRRACVIRFCPPRGGAKWGQDQWMEYWSWLDNGGAEAVYDYLLSVDLSGFDPKGWAPMTEDKAEVTNSTRRADEQWVKMLQEDPDQVLTPVLKGRALMTNGELAQYCYAEDPSGVSPGKKNSLGIKMHSAGFQKITLKVAGKPERFWVIRNKDHEWTLDEARAHLKAQKYPGA